MESWEIPVGRLFRGHVPLGALFAGPVVSVVVDVVSCPGPHRSPRPRMFIYPLFLFTLDARANRLEGPTQKGWIGRVVTGTVEKIAEKVVIYCCCTKLSIFVLCEAHSEH